MGGECFEDLIAQSDFSGGAPPKLERRTDRRDTNPGLEIAPTCEGVDRGDLVRIGDQELATELCANLVSAVGVYSHGTQRPSGGAHHLFLEDPVGSEVGVEARTRKKKVIGSQARHQGRDRNLPSSEFARNVS